MQWDDLKWWGTGSNKMEALDKPTTFPPRKYWYEAFKLTPFDKVKVVILGQDPHYKKGHAHGLAFSVQPHVKHLPSSLRNVLKEYSEDLGFHYPSTGNLSSWADRGTLLLNSIFTVEEDKPLSHQAKGWEHLTYEAVSSLSKQRSGLVWLLWGKHAQEYRALIDEAKHHVLVAGHPGGYSCNLFLGCKHFSKACVLMGEPKEYWKLP